MTNKTRENIKTVTLVVLFIMTILLLYLYISGSGQQSFEDLIPFKKTIVDAPSIEEFIIPETVYISNGDGTFGSISNKKTVYDKAQDVLINICKNSAVAAEISNEQYDEAMEKNESIQINFRFAFPFDSYCKYFGIRRTTSFSNIDSLSSISFSDGILDSAIITTNQGTHYRIIASESFDWKELVLDSAQFSDITFYKASDVLGINSKVLIPVLGTPRLSSGYATAEYSIEKYTFRQGLAKEIFGETLNFVRRIVDNFANVTYIYGYGQRSLIFFAEGAIEYKAENTSGKSNGFFGDLETAINFVEQYGGWKVDGTSSSFYLSSYATSNTSNTYYFSQYLNEELVYANPTATITVVVSNGDVSYYNRAALRVTASSYSAESVYPAVNAAMNVLSTLEGNNDFSSFAKSITKVQAGYLREDDYIYPVWVFYTDTDRYFADLFTGEVYIPD